MAFEQHEKDLDNKAKQERAALTEEALHLQLAYGGGGFSHCGDDGCGWDRENRRHREKRSQQEQEES